MEIFFGAIKSTFDASFLPSQFSPTLLHVCYLFKALEFPFAAHSPLLIHCALTGLLSRLNSADYWICTNYTPKILKLIPNIILPQKDLPISGIKDLGGK